MKLKASRKILLEGVDRTDWIIWGLFVIVCFVSYQHGDILHTGGSSIAYLNGHFADFYEWRHTTEDVRQAYYDWEIHYTVMMKGTQFEKEHGKAVLSEDNVEIIFENEAGYVLKIDL